MREIKIDADLFIVLQFNQMPINVKFSTFGSFGLGARHTITDLLPLRSGAKN